MSPAKVVIEPINTGCLNGWGETPKHPSCNYTGGHYCEKDYEHKGRCRCGCGSTSTTKPPKRGDDA